MNHFSAIKNLIKKHSSLQIELVNYLHKDSVELAKDFMTSSLSWYSVQLAQTQAKANSIKPSPLT